MFGARTVWKATKPVPERRFDVDNIIILTGHSEANDSFIALLSMLFPECEIQVLSRRTGNIEDVSVFPGPAPGDSGGKKNGKHFDCP